MTTPKEPSSVQPTNPEPAPAAEKPKKPPANPAVEIGGPTGPEPTRYKDWERKGRVSDF